MLRSKLNGKVFVTELMRQAMSDKGFFDSMLICLAMTFHDFSWRFVMIGARSNLLLGDAGWDASCSFSSVFSSFINQPLIQFDT